MRLIDSQLEEELFPYIGGIVKREGGVLLAIGGMEDHLHLLIRLRPSHQISEVVRRIKGNSSRWVNEKRGRQTQFKWQRGYGIFTVGESNAKAVARYILHQKEHHQRQPFRQEYLSLLEKHRVEYDEAFLWDD